MLSGRILTRSLIETQTVNTTGFAFDFHVVLTVAIFKPKVHTQVWHQGAAEPEGVWDLLEFISKDQSSKNRTWKSQGFIRLSVARLSLKTQEASCSSSDASLSIVQCSLYFRRARPL